MYSEKFKRRRDYTFCGRALEDIVLDLAFEMCLNRQIEFRQGKMECCQRREQNEQKFSTMRSWHVFGKQEVIKFYRNAEKQ